MFLLGNFVSAAALIGCGLTANLAALLLLRWLAGLFAAFAFIVGATLTSQVGQGASPNRQGLLISIYFAGAGFGIKDRRPRDALVTFSAAFRSAVRG